MSQIESQGGQQEPNLSLVDLEKTKTPNKSAQAIVRSTGRDWGISWEKDRVFIPGLKDARFQIATGSSMARALLPERFVKVSTKSGGEVILNVNSLAKRLLLSRREILEAAKAGGGKLESMIHERAEKLSKHTECYVEIFQHYELDVAKDRLKFRANPDQHYTPLSANQLFKVVDRAFTEFDAMKEKGGGDITEKGVPLEEGGQVFIAKFEPVGKTHQLSLINYSDVQKFSKQRQVGKGQFGTVYSVANLAQGGMQALKIAHNRKKYLEMRMDESEASKMAQRAEGGLRKEVHNINLTEEGETRKPVALVDITHNGEPILAMLGPLYKGNLSTFTEKEKPSTQQALNACDQLVDSFVSIKDLHHADIKRGNMLYGVVDGRPVFKIADLDCQRYDAPHYTPKIGSHTPGYMSDIDHSNLKELEKQCDALEQNMRGAKMQVKSAEVKLLQVDIRLHHMEEGVKRIQGEISASNNDPERIKELNQKLQEKQEGCHLLRAEKENIKKYISAVESFKTAIKAHSAFSFGVSLYAILTRYAPYGIDPHDDEACLRVGSTNFDNNGKLSEVLGGTKNPLYQLIKDACHPDPAKRPTPEQFQDRWKKARTPHS